MLFLTSIAGMLEELQSDYKTTQIQEQITRVNTELEVLKTLLQTEHIIGFKQSHSNKGRH